MTKATPQAMKVLVKALFTAPQYFAFTDEGRLQWFMQETGGDPATFDRLRARIMAAKETPAKETNPPIPINTIGESKPSSSMSDDMATLDKAKAGEVLDKKELATLERTRAALKMVQEVFAIVDNDAPVIAMSPKQRRFLAEVGPKILAINSTDPNVSQLIGPRKGRLTAMIAELNNWPRKRYGNTGKQPISIKSIEGKPLEETEEFKEALQHEYDLAAERLENPERYVINHSKNLILDNAIKVRDYASLNENITRFAEGRIPFLIIIGATGTGKSKGMQLAVQHLIDEQQLCWINNDVSAYGLYETAFDYKDLPIVMDDIQGVKHEVIAIMKQLTQTENNKTMTWTKRIQDPDLPKRYTTRSHVCLIMNEWKPKNEHLAAIQDRARLILFDPDKETIHAYAGTWFHEKDIYDFIGDNLRKVARLTNRYYFDAMVSKNAGFDWRKELLDKFMPDDKKVVVVDLFTNDAYKEKSVKQKSELFMGRTGASRNTFFLIKKEYGF